MTRLIFALRNKKPKRFFITISFLVVSILFLCFIPFDNNGITASMDHKKLKLVIPDSVQFQSGDLIVRHGKGFISNAFRMFSLKEAKYSHSGWISMENGKAFVYHAIGGEENPDNKLRRDALTDFCSSESIYSFGLFRYTISRFEKQSIDSLVHMYYQCGLEFDTSLDLKTDNKMYCSEFVYKVLEKATPNKKIIPLSEISGNNYIAIDNLYINSYCKPIFQYSYPSAISNH